jgi:hypothetical protein
VVELIYCAAGNRRFAQIALDAGFRYGAQLPNTIYHSPYFVDQNWRKPDRNRYMTALATHKPHMATVLDLERDEQLPEVLDWAQEAAAHVQVVVVIPKAQGIIAHLPRFINGTEVRLGYSVPTRFAGTEVPVWEFTGWPVHLLGGSPQNQLRLARYLNVQSADGNAAQRAALTGIEWRRGKWGRGQADLGTDMPYHVFATSCRNIVAAWQALSEKELA